MKLKSKYLNGVIEFIDCIVVFQYGIIQRIKFDYPSGTSPKDYSDFVVRKHSKYQLGVYPHGYNYILTFLDSNDKEQKIFFKLNPLQAFRLNWILNKYWIQKTDNWVKFIIPIITTIGTYLITKEILCK
ncbi:hypothetical protein ACFQ1R_11415 [Mariniflexile jejuense]|uniref:Uncharacterized protein n=1 Tax=Mariniflexile jejuense TaxID=1173582 RepID=A0ABW3JN35_9FLAO